MAEVTGRIGNEEVELHNAATEATLRLLLQSSLTANKQSVDNITKLAAKAGLDPAAVAAANANLKGVSETSKNAQGTFYKLGVVTGVVEQGFRNVDKAISPLIGALMDGTDKASVVFEKLGKLPGPLGLVVDQFIRLAKFQEKNLEVYQGLTQTGINFGGSLTQMRMAAQNSYLTLDQFAKVMKANSQTFANLGGNVNDGAMAFSKLSNSLVKSEAGDYLRNLGYTSEEVNNGLASYLTATGGRNKQEMKNTEQLIKGATEYMGQMQGLADLTGKNREELDKEMKERAKNAAWESQLAGMSEEEKAKAVAGLANALAVGGKGAADAFQSKVMGLPPLTKEAQMFTAVMGKTNDSVMRSAKNVSDSSKTVQDQNKELVTSIRANEQDSKKFSNSFGFAATALGIDAAKTIDGANALRTRTSKLTDEDIAKNFDQAAKKKALAESEAAAAVQTQKAVQEMGQTIMSALLPVINLLTPAMNAVVRGFGWIVEKLAEFKIVTIGLVAALTAYWAMQKYQNIMEKVNVAKAAGGKGKLGGLTLSGAMGIAGALGTKTNPMYVIILGNAAGGVLDQILEGGGGGNKGGKGGGSKGGKGVKGLLKGGSSVLKSAGIIGALAGIATGVMDWNDIEKNTSLSDEEKKKQKGGVVGETGGGLAGGLVGAATGAAIGSMVPIIGTAIGGLLGGAIGAYGGAWAGKAGGEALAPKLAAGGIVTKPTMIQAGEEGPEAILPLSHLETLRLELQTLNKQTAEALKYIKETAEYTRRTVDATKSLGGDLFKF
jgi:tryptophan synthase alpha subunit